MREGRSGIYFAEGGRMGFRLCMLDKTQLNSWYRDPYLLAIVRAANAEKSVRDPWFTGYETDPRWMMLHKSGTRIRCIDAGFVLQPPPDTEHLDTYHAVCDALGIGDDHMLSVPSTGTAGRRIDAEDRVALGANLLGELIAAGL